MRRSAIAAGVAALATAVAAAAFATGRPQSPAPAPLDDATIIAIFDAANTADIETGRLAAERARSVEVREYGEMLARDHAAVRQLGRDLAKKLGVTPTPPKDDAAAKAHADAMATLRGKQGEEFDRAFLAHEIGFHRSVGEAIRTTLLPAIRNPELKTLVEKVAPAFDAHRMRAEQLAAERDGASTGGRE